MAKTRIKVDFDRLLDDITYTNMVTKNFDVSDIITRNQYYELKDAIVLWLPKHSFTENFIDGFEHVIGKDGKKIELIKLTLKHGNTVCRVHQPNEKRVRVALGLLSDVDSIEPYSIEPNNDVDFDETRFRESISNMKTNRLRFMRDSSPNFGGTVINNLKSGNPWMKPYLELLPFKGKMPIEIIDSKEN